MHTVTRRSFVTMAAAATLAPACSPVGTFTAARPAPARDATPPLRSSGGSAYLFFDAAEAQFIEAACECLIPADESGPGALIAGVPGYLDSQLGGAWGRGESLYRSGPWQPGTGSLELRRPFIPAELFRAALRAINLGFAKAGTTFDELPCQAQRAFLAALESGTANLGVPSAAFFDLLLKMTVEAFFSHPVYGETRDRLAWRMIGFPGAFAACASHRACATRRL